MISFRVFFLLIAFVLSFAITARASPAPIDGLQPYVVTKNQLGLGNGNHTIAVSVFLLDCHSMGLTLCQVSETNSAEAFGQSWTAIIFVVAAAVWNIQFA
ncbi:hypothetical protein EDD18DRAFT_285752 [Armillaria luteobubalina]|uniref:Uncharacterized protein n=1 Tax=Armillaria luteobubalina TaxID=153913 RepID=A0AA39Q2C6_9AGAR|nr:hypothetical protein EDD18DRAFT_285752 [Armillaria luteobubalina]